MRCQPVDGHTLDIVDILVDIDTVDIHRQVGKAEHLLAFVATDVDTSQTDVAVDVHLQKLAQVADSMEMRVELAVHAAHLHHVGKVSLHIGDGKLFQTHTHLEVVVVEVEGGVDSQRAAVGELQL